MPVSLPHTLSNGSNGDADQVQGNFNALKSAHDTLESTVTSNQSDHEDDRVTDRAYTDTQADAAETAATAVATAHITDTSDAHDASAISFVDYETLTSASVQLVIEESWREWHALNDAVEARLDDLEAETWTNLSVSNGWVDYTGRQDAEYRKVGDEVQLRGQIRSGTITDGTVIATLPSGYRPPAADVFPVPATGGTAAYFYITTGGQVQIFNLANNNGLGLSGVRFSTS